MNTQLTKVILLFFSLCAFSLNGKETASWQPLSGQWSVEREDALEVNSLEGTSITLIGSKDFQNYSWEADVIFIEVKDPSSWLGLIFRADKRTESWSQATLRFASSQRNGLEIAHRKGQKWAVQQSTRIKQDCTIGEKRHFKVEIRDTVVKVWIDGQLIVNSAACFDASHGLTGLIVDGCRVKFDNVKFTAMPASALKKRTNKKDCRIVAHRGFSRIAPENTIASIKESIKVGADFSEFDVYQTKDGKVVLMHDRTLDRTTNGSGEAKEKTVAELKKLDAGSWKSNAFSGEKIPTLQEALVAFQGTSCRPVIEIKDPQATSRVIGIIKELNLQDKVSVISFDPGVVKAFSQQVPTVECAWLSGNYPEGMTSTPVRIQYLLQVCDALGIRVLNLRYNMLSPQIIEALHQQGVAVWCWTVNDPPTMKHINSWNIDAMTTDNPDYLKDVLGK